MKKSLFFLVLPLSLTLSGQNDTIKITNQNKEIVLSIKEGLNYLNGSNGKERDAEKAFSIFEAGALEGNDVCQYLVGRMSLEGIGTKQNDIQAESWYLKSAESGNPLSQFELGMFYKHGKKGGVNFREAVKWFQKAADNGVPNALYSMGYMYLKGFHVSQDYCKAFEYFSRAEQKGNPPGAFMMGYCYEKGYGVPKDPDKAMKLYEMAASGGYQMAVERIKKTKEGKLKSGLILPDSLSCVLHGPHLQVYSTGYPVDFDDCSVGTMVIYDWSGQNAVELHTFQLFRDESGLLSISIDENQNAVPVSVIGNSIRSTGILFSRPGALGSEVRWLLKSISFEKKEVAGKEFLMGDAVSWSPELREPGEYIQVILPKMKKPEVQAVVLPQKEDLTGLVAYPNPFDQKITIAFFLENDSEVTLTLTNMKGQIIKKVLDGVKLKNGRQTYEVDDIHIPGIYTVVLEANGSVKSIKIVKTN